MLDYDDRLDKWLIESSCPEAVRITSEKFNTKSGRDVLTIAESVYSGEADIDQFVNPKFNVSFSSGGSYTYGGFILNWACVDFGRLIFIADFIFCNSNDSVVIYSKP